MHTAESIATQPDLGRVQLLLDSLYHQTGNMANVVRMASAAIDDAFRWNEPPEWEVTAGTSTAEARQEQQ